MPSVTFNGELKWEPIYDILDWRQRNPQKVKDILYVQYLVNK